MLFLKFQSFQGDNEFIGLEISEELLPAKSQFIHPNYALLMAGGRGSRLRPITDDCPKPLYSNK